MTLGDPATRPSKPTLLFTSVYRKLASLDGLDNRALLLFVENMQLAMIESQVDFFFDLGDERGISSGFDQVLSDVCVHYYMRR